MPDHQEAHQPAWFIESSRHTSRCATTEFRSTLVVGPRGALVKVLDKPYLDLTSTMGQGILAFLSALAQDERERIVKRAQDGREAAKARGVKFGRKPKLA